MLCPLCDAEPLLRLSVHVQVNVFWADQPCSRSAEHFQCVANSLDGERWTRSALPRRLSHRRCTAKCSTMRQTRTGPSIEARNSVPHDAQCVMTSPDVEAGTVGKIAASCRLQHLLAFSSITLSGLVASAEVFTGPLGVEPVACSSFSTNGTSFRPLDI